MRNLVRDLRCLSIACAVLLGAQLVCPCAATGQTTRPLVSEFQREARGRFEVVNDSDRDLYVTVEPRGFSVDAEGELHDEPLPDHVHLKLSAMSLKLPARQSRMIFYDATADRAPSWFVLYANFTGYRAREFSGVNVQLELPHIVYILPKERLTSATVRVIEAKFQADGKTLELVLENSGPAFGRIASLQVRGARHKASAPGFPLFPGQRRRVRVEWDAAERPDSVHVDGRDFSLQHTLAALGP